MAETIRYHLPQSHRHLINLSRYPETKQPFQMRINWSALNNNVIAKIGMCVGSF